MRKFISGAGQTLVEYLALLFIIIAVFTVMGPLIKRVSQGMIKIVSDEVGVQANADQSYNADYGLSAKPAYLIETRIQSQTDHSERTIELYGVTARSYTYNDLTQTNTLSDAGFSERD